MGLVPLLALQTWQLSAYILESLECWRSFRRVIGVTRFGRYAVANIVAFGVFAVVLSAGKSFPVELKTARKAAMGQWA
jgi:hypothetical protein